MGGSVKRIDTSAFQAAISAMERAVAHFQSARSDIIRITDPVVDNWEGEGAGSFQRVYKKLKIELEDEETNLSTIRDGLVSILESYEGWDQEMQANIQKG